jgi:hypothetical protein
MILQQTGYVLNGPGRIEEKRDMFNNMYSDLYSRFQQTADRLEDEVCHAKQILRGHYAAYLEAQKRKKEEEEEQARKRERERELELQREEERKREAIAKAELEKKKLEAQKDVIMLDSPVQTPQAAKGVSGSQTATPLASTAINEPAKSFEATFPATQTTTNNDNPVAGDELDFEALFGMSTADTDQNTAMDLTNDSFADPSADVASLIPGIDAYASMDQSAPTTTMATTAVPAPALDFMDFTVADTPTQANAGQADAGVVADFSTSNLDDELNNFLNSGDAGGSANDGDWDDWLNGME